MPSPIHIIGGGLSGTECAWQLAERGVEVVLHEMRPVRSTPAHKTGDLAELVCSNSLRSDDPLHAAGLLKREMEVFGSLIIGSARAAAVPAGSALAVDRDRFAERVTAAIGSHPRIELRREEVLEIPEGDVVIGTGPLTSEAMSGQLQGLLGSDYLYFYDAIAPIVEAESLDLSKLFWQSRYGKGEGDDYLNAPMNKEEYLAFRQAVLDAEVVAPHEFEKAVFFEGCLPIEELARRGEDTLRYGPMKPVGLTAPDGRRPYAVVQLRQENLAKSHFNLVGFQSRMKWGEQPGVLRLIPGLENANFVRFGQIHRNTFINAPVHLDKLYRVKAEPRVRLAGQITGVEGYLESAATGLAIGLYLSLERQGRAPEPFPATTALGAMARHLTESDPKHFQPANINYGLFEELSGRLRKADRRTAYADRARAELLAWAERNGVPVDPSPPGPLSHPLPPTGRGGEEEASEQLVGQTVDGSLLPSPGGPGGGWERGRG
ncbi:MAG TPA: methylenetetrahydrofolate--tRNA-(uracil(54)-C(5))-methyltransferase (FADH(2)-oxidizing) TrmFO [Thermoanaerobaculia bacterium]